MSSKAPFFRIAFLLLALGSSSSSRAQAKSYDIGGKVLWPGTQVFESLISHTSRQFTNEMLTPVLMQETRLQHQR